MYLIDTCVISEARKKDKANPGVRQFFARVEKEGIPVYLSVVAIGELRRGIELIRQRNDLPQAECLEGWFDGLLREYEDCILDFDVEMAQMWGKLRVPFHENALDKQMAATALLNDLTVVTRNVEHFKATPVKLFNPFT